MLFLGFKSRVFCQNPKVVALGVDISRIASNKLNKQHDPSVILVGH